MIKRISMTAAVLSLCVTAGGDALAASLDFADKKYSVDAKEVPVPKPAAAAAARNWNYAAGEMQAGIFYRGKTGSDPELNLSTAGANFPGLNTFLWYKGLIAVPSSLPASFFAAAKAAGVTPQIAFESNSYDLPTMRRALEGKGALPGTTDAARTANACYKQMAAWAVYLKDKCPVNFRPLSEMNDASGNWQMGKKGNTPEEFAAVWNGMRALFDELGAVNLRWTFTPLGVIGDPRLPLVRQALKLIPAGNIDNVGINPYAMKSGGNFESFRSLVDPWLELFAKTGHSARPVISEMGVSNNPKTHNEQGNKDPDYLAPGSEAYKKLDALRAAWIHAAFAYAREKKFASVTYFDQQDACWRVDKGSLAYKALQKEIAR